MDSDYLSVSNNNIETFVGNRGNSKSSGSNNISAANQRNNITQHNFASINTAPSGSTNITKTLGASGNTSSLFRPSNISNITNTNARGRISDSLGSRNVSNLNKRDNINARISNLNKDDLNAILSNRSTISSNRLNTLNDTAKARQNLRQDNINKLLESKNVNNDDVITGVLSTALPNVAVNDFATFRANFLQDPTHANWNAKYISDKFWKYHMGYLNNNNVWISGYWAYTVPGETSNPSDQNDFFKYMLDEFIKYKIDNAKNVTEGFDMISKDHTFIVILIILICLVFLIKSLHK